MSKLAPASILVLALALAGCGIAPPRATLPPDTFAGAGDPTRSAVFETAYAFRASPAAAGQPAQFARAVAEVEYLATEFPADQRWTQFSPSVARELEVARAELRTALGIWPEAPAQVVVELLFAAARFLAAGDVGAAERALLSPIFPDAAATLARLRQPPALPRTRIATALAHAELNRIDREGSQSGGDGDGKG